MQDGDVAEWLRSGLQSRAHRFDSGRRLQLGFRKVPLEPENQFHLKNNSQKNCPQCSGLVRWHPQNLLVLVWASDLRVAQKYQHATYGHQRAECTWQGEAI